MKCKNCGAELADNALFCSSCGYQVRSTTSSPENDENSQTIVASTEALQRRKKIGIAIAFVIAVILAIGGSTGYWLWYQSQKNQALSICMEQGPAFEKLKNKADEMIPEAEVLYYSDATEIVDSDLVETLYKNYTTSYDTKRDIKQCFPNMSKSEIDKNILLNKSIEESLNKYIANLSSSMKNVKDAITNHEYTFGELWNTVVERHRYYPMNGKYCRHDGACVVIESTDQGDSLLPVSPMATISVDEDSTVWNIFADDETSLPFSTSYQSVRPTPSEAEWIDCEGLNPDEPTSAADMHNTFFIYSFAGTPVPDAYFTWDITDNGNPVDTSKTFLAITYYAGDFSEDPIEISDDTVFYKQ